MLGQGRARRRLRLPQSGRLRGGRRHRGEDRDRGGGRRRRRHRPAGARYARAFNSQAWETFADPRGDGEPGHLFYTVFDAADAPTVEALISAVGLVPAFAGLGRPDLLDAALFLMVPAYETHGRRTGLRLVHD